MLDLTIDPRLSQLSTEKRELLTKVDDYALDYNIFLSKGVDDIIKSNDKQLISFIQKLFITIPDEYVKLIYNPINETSEKINPSTTSKLQKRLLSLLIQERHRRDIYLLNKQFDDKIKYIELEDPFKYEIKSHYFKIFSESNDDFKEQFNKIALFQSLEYDFEHVLDDDSDYQNDDDIVDNFCDDKILQFKVADFKKEDDVINDEIAKLLMPMASQVILSPNEEEEE